MTSNDYSPLKVQTTGGTNEPESLTGFSILSPMPAIYQRQPRSSISASLPSASQFKSSRTDWNASFFPEAPEVSS